MFARLLRRSAELPATFPPSVIPLARSSSECANNDLAHEGTHDPEKAAQLLAEVNIYYSYGKITQAFDTLKEYLDIYPYDLPQIGRLINLARETKNSEKIYDALLLARSSNLIPDEELIAIALEELKRNQNDIYLHAFLMENVGLEEEDLNFLAPDLSSPVLIASGDETPVSVTNHFSSAPSLADSNSRPVEKTNKDYFSSRSLDSAAKVNPWPLFRGYTSTAPFSDQECQIVFSLVSPRFLLDALVSSEDWEKALYYAVRACSVFPAEIYFVVTLLHIAYRLRDVDLYQKYARLLIERVNPRGRDLIKRIIAYGASLSLSQELHDCWREVMNSSVDASGRELITEGTKLPSAGTPALSALELLLRSTSGDPALKTFSELIEYGQVEEASDWLESLCRTRTDDRYWNAFKELCERRGESERYLQLKQPASWRHNVRLN